MLDPSGKIFNSHHFVSIKIGEETIKDRFELKNVRFHSHCIGLLKLLGIVEALPYSGTVFHLNKASLIKQYRETLCPKGLSNDEIMTIIRASSNQVKSQSTNTTNAENCNENFPTKGNVQSDKLESKTSTNVITSGPLSGMTIQNGPLAENIESHSKAIQFIDNLAAYMKISLVTTQQLHADIKAQFQMLKLINDQGEWISPELAKIGGDLLPEEEQTREKCEVLIDMMANAIKQNPYFLAAIENLKEKDLNNLGEKLKSENGKKMIAYLIPYAMALNGLTSTFAKDVDLFIKIDDFWAKEKPRNVKKYMHLFGWIKYLTLGRLSSIKKPIQMHSIHRKANRNYVSFNIAEAVIADRFFKGNKHNAAAGDALIRHPAGNKKNARTGAGPTTIGVTRGEYEVIKLRPELPKEWADLYTVWNLAFCSNADSFPLLSLKLLIPSVNDYATDPQSYIHHRGLALYLYFQFTIFREMSQKEPTALDFLKGWHSKGITEALGEANIKSAEDYESRIKNARKGRR